jgi:hypothetical protein
MTEKGAGQAVPDSLIYETVDGRPIYYKGYREVLSGTKQLVEIMGDGNIQSFLKLHIGALLIRLLGSEYIVTGGEQGLQLKEKSTRAADIAIFKASDFEWSPKYSSTAPLVVIEIDTKADLESFGEAIDYYDEKTSELLDFGVQKVIWILTESEKVKVASADQRPSSYDWSEDVPVIEDITINIQHLIDEAPFEK